MPSMGLGIIGLGSGFSRLALSGWPSNGVLYVKAFVSLLPISIGSHREPWDCAGNTMIPLPLADDGFCYLRMFLLDMFSKTKTS